MGKFWDGFFFVFELPLTLFSDPAAWGIIVGISIILAGFIMLAVLAVFGCELLFERKKK